MKVISKMLPLVAAVLYSSIGLAADQLDVDVVVVGSGSTGVSATAAAHQKGKKVVLIEKMPIIGGSSALAGGAIAAGNSNAQKRAGSKDTTPEGFIKIWLDDQERSYPGGDPAYPDKEKVEKMTYEFTDTVNWLEDTIGHRFAKPRPFGYGGPDYAHAPADAPIPASGRGSVTGVGGGGHVIKAFKAYFDKEGVPVMVKTPAKELITNDKGDVIGVKADSDGKELIINAKAVILACGGFAHNKEMLQKWVPSYAQYADVSAATVGDTGDGITMAEKVGAVPYEDAWTIGLFLGSPKKELDKTFTTVNKYKDCLFVNEKGERFVNEDLPYLADATAAQGAAWAFVDSKDPQKVAPLNEYNDPAISVKGNTVEELAKAMGVPPEALAKTVADYNAACDSGSDPQFHKPKDHLFPFKVAPFYAVRVVPQTGGTIGGVKVNDKFQVIRKDGSVIKGLYAGGEMINRPYYGRVYTSGTGLGIGYTSGRIAGTNAAEEK